MGEDSPATLAITPEALAKCLALTFPPAMVQLVQELVAPIPAFDNIAKIIQSDPVLSATVLTLVNSPFYGMTSKVTNLERAAVVLGTREILKIALSISFQQNASRSIKRSKKSLFSDWRLSVWSSIAAEQIATRLIPKEAHLAYLAGLLKDLSLFLYLCLEQDGAKPEDHACFLWLEEQQMDAERARWGETHAELTRTLLSEWSLPPLLLEAIAHHHDMEQLEVYSPLSQSVILATRWAELQHATTPDHGAIIQFELQMRALLKLDDAQLEVLRDECTQRFESLLQLLGIQNASPDSRFYSQSLQSMQSFYFHAMEISNSINGVEGMGRTICRQLRWNWGVEHAQLALRTAGGNAFVLFTILPEEASLAMNEAPALSKLPWKVKGEKMQLGPKGQPYGELRYTVPPNPVRSMQEMPVYSNFITTTLAAYYKDHAVMATKARVLQALPIGVALTDLEGTVLDVNQRFLSFDGGNSTPGGVGYNVAEVLKNTLGIPVEPMFEALREEKDRHSISQLFYVSVARQHGEGQCLYLSIHRHEVDSSPAYLVVLEDISDLSAIEMQAFKQRDFLEKLVAAMQETILIVNIAGEVVWSAPASLHLVGRNLFEFTKPTGTFTGDWNRAFLATGPAPAMPVEVDINDGVQDVSQLELVFSPLHEADEVTRSYLVVGRDLTLIRRLEHKIRQQAMFDGLTGLFNYSQFNTVLTREVERSARTGRGMGLIFFDLDRFKQVNDTYGHQTGDRLLKLIAKGVMQSVRKGMDFPCRYGGDEFAIVVTEVDRPTLEMMCTRLHEMVRKQCQDTVSLSIGVALLRPDETAEQMLQRVDKASYTAKHQGGAQTCWED
ncbi:HDOD domain-containing protein [Desulfovibrio mangrovi]|uniref:HDOD domain-containing protein n=1 Tax=Desulfovibrio mangrovi TaxID=2976983 RepID=UPI00224517BB|nr:HDOD domain-containing protein [Desulfovibrio mangrovi]UZP66498.1 HDOD domain-containing protein [Desulfovibrio mangrovi]